MKIPTISAVLYGYLFVCCAGAFASAEQTPSAERGPTFSDTISFLNRSVEPENSYIVSDNKCEMVILRNRTYNIAIPTGTYVKSIDKFGIKHSGFKWLFAHEPNMTKFNFATIDPRSIESLSVPSAAFIKQNDVDETPSLLKNPDLTVVWFKTSDLTLLIEEGHLPKLTDGEDAKVVSPVFDHNVSSGFIAFESKDRAERFVTAFVHAVSMCGGKGSDFAPTPSKP